MLAFLFQGFLQISPQSAAGAGFFDVLMIAKIMILILAAIHIVLAIRVWIQIRRLQAWLPMLKGHYFNLWAAIHLALAALGFLFALVVL